MLFDQKMRKAELALGIETQDDWCEIPPSWILNQDGVGPVTLNKIRLYLASDGRTLKDDGTPSHWLQKFAKTPSAMAASDYRIPIPFTVVIDDQEKQPFLFQGITADRRDWTSDVRWLFKNELIEASEVKYLIPTVVRSLGASHGDYSIDGFEGRVHVERKSCADAQGTILGWHERRERFIRELEYLNGIEYAAVIVECSFDEMVKTVGSRGKKTAAENRKVLARQAWAFQCDVRVPWGFFGSRQFAEIMTFRTLHRFYKKQQKRARQAAKETDAELALI